MSGAISLRTVPGNIVEIITIIVFLLTSLSTSAVTFTATE